MSSSVKGLFGICIDRSYSQSYWFFMVFLSSFVNCCPSPFLSGLTLHPPPPPWCEQRYLIHICSAYQGTNSPRLTQFPRPWTVNSFYSVQLLLSAVQTGVTLIVRMTKRWGELPSHIYDALFIDIYTTSTYIYRVQSSVWRLTNYWRPTPSPPSECVLPPQQRRRVHTLRAVTGWGEGPRGSIFRKTPDIGLASYSIIHLRSKLSSIAWL
jgi:hypothetical protein